MEILVIFDETTIRAWLAGEPIESVADHIANGYPGLQAGYESGAILAEIITVDETETYRPDLYTVLNGHVVRAEPEATP